jgi:hypothetical protein
VRLRSPDAVARGVLEANGQRQALGPLLMQVTVDAMVAFIRYCLAGSCDLPPLVRQASSRINEGRTVVARHDVVPASSPLLRTHTHTHTHTHKRTNTKHFIHCLTPWVQLDAPLYLYTHLVGGRRPLKHKTFHTLPDAVGAISCTLYLYTHLVGGGAGHSNTKHFIHCLTPWVQLAAPCTCTHTL